MQKSASQTRSDSTTVRKAVEAAQETLKLVRGESGVYAPQPTGNTHEHFKDSPLLHYKVFDKNFKAVSEIVYSHSLEELYFQAIDNADRLGTLDVLFSLRPNFSARRMTVRDMILTSYVGTGDGKISHIFAAPYQSHTAASLDTELYALAVSEMIPNAASLPLRLALNVSPAMKKWSGMSGLKLFASTIPDAQLQDLNRRVNQEQIIELRNDPEGCVRYSQRYLEHMREQKEKNEQGAKNSEGTESAKAQSGQYKFVQGSGPNPSESLAVLQRAEADRSAQKSELPPQSSQSATGSNPERKMDLSSINAPTRAAKLERMVTSEFDSMAVDSNESAEAFKHLDGEQQAKAAAA
ncbi:hypothetical protein PYCC9005_004265 [Savitreella phatthalungensis]